MSTLHLRQTTNATPEQFLAALTDFGPDRSSIFPNSQDQHLEVHSRRDTDDDVTEGIGGVCNGCTTTGPTRPASGSPTRTPTWGAADPATSTPAAPGPTAAPTSTRS